MKEEHLVKRWLVLTSGLFIMAFGIAFSIKAGLGTSPISSLPYVVSLLVPVSVGTATMIMHLVFIALQILLLRKDFKLFQLLQLPVALLFGVLTDIAVWAVQFIQVESYMQQWIFCILGIILVGIGVSFEVAAEVVTLAGEGLILAICTAYKTPFHKTKIAFDSSLVASAVILSLLFTSSLQGVREGTVAAAIFVGIVAKKAGGLQLFRRDPQIM